MEPLALYLHNVHYSQQSHAFESPQAWWTRDLTYIGLAGGLMLLS